MADQHKSDIVMRFVQMDGKPVYAECALDVNPSDRFMTDFHPATYDNYSDFFEVSKFSSGFEVKDEDQSKSRLGSDNTTGRSSNKKSVGLVQGEFASWRSATDTQAAEVIYPLECQTFRLDRLIDAASPIFFEHCCKSISFKAATLVKRVATGGANLPVGFLKIDFQSVLITSLNWDDGDMTMEKCEFICRDFKLQYRQQKADGTLSARAEASWNYKTDALPDKN